MSLTKAIANIPSAVSMWLRPIEVPLAFAPVRAPLAARKQDLDLRPQQFPAAIAEHLLRLGIGEHDAPPAVDADNSLRRRFEQCHRQLVAFAQESDRVAPAIRATRREIGHGPPWFCSYYPEFRSQLRPSCISTPESHRITSLVSGHGLSPILFA
jgi:hypothetical protein